MNSLNVLPLLYGQVIQEGKQAVIRPHHQLLPNAGSHEPAVRSHTRIHHSHMHAPGGKIGHGAFQSQRPGQDILGRYGMGDVYNVNIRAKAIDHPFHHAHKTILQAKIG